MIALLFRVCIFIALAFGILMMASPTGYRGLLSRIARVSGQNSDSEPSARDAGENWQVRLAGLLIVLGVSFILWRIITFNETPKIPASEHGTAIHSAIGSMWLDAAVGLTLVAAGTYIVLQPAVVVRWNARILSRGMVPEGKVKEWRIGARVLGAAAVVAGAFILYYWAVRAPH